MLSNLLEKVGQIAANGTSEDLDFNIFQGRMCSEPPSNVITIISLQLSDFLPGSAPVCCKCLRIMPIEKDFQSEFELR